MLNIGTKATEMSGGTNAGFLDTLALAYHHTGDTGKTLEIQRQAMSLLPSGESPLRTELEANIAKYRRAAKN